MQEVGPGGIFERELVGVYFESVPDGRVHDGLCPFAEWSLSGGGLDKLGVAVAEREANHADPLNMQTGEGCRRKSVADGEAACEIEIRLKDTLKVVLKISFIVRSVTGEGKEGSAPEDFLRTKLGTMCRHQLRARQCRGHDPSQAARWILARFLLDRVWMTWRSRVGGPVWVTAVTSLLPLVLHLSACATTVPR